MVTEKGKVIQDEVKKAQAHKDWSKLEEFLNFISPITK